MHFAHVPVKGDVNHQHISGLEVFGVAWIAQLGILCKASQLVELGHFVQKARVLPEPGAPIVAFRGGR